MLNNIVQFGCSLGAMMGTMGGKLGIRGIPMPKNRDVRDSICNI